MTLEEIIQDLHALEERIRANERKYGITSKDFYELYRQGLLDDDGFEQTTEFIRWASAYEIKLEREAAFEKMSRAFLQTLRQETTDHSLRLTPNPQLACA
ncbi:MAG: hypothetical protein H8D78_07340 [Chloroflexi bacterium]|nr:hypothetical protein [Chloroflexota bacterium]